MQAKSEVFGFQMVTKYGKNDPHKRSASLQGYAVRIEPVTCCGVGLGRVNLILGGFVRPEAWALWELSNEKSSNFSGSSLYGVGLVGLSRRSGT